MDFKKIVDQCTNGGSPNVQPAPSAEPNPGLAFHKCSPYNHVFNCDTIYMSLMSPNDCRWADCGLPSFISSKSSNTQQTMAIYVHYKVLTKADWGVVISYFIN